MLIFCQLLLTENGILPHFVERVQFSRQAPWVHGAQIGPTFVECPHLQIDDIPVQAVVFLHEFHRFLLLSVQTERSLLGSVNSASKAFVLLDTFLHPDMCQPHTSEIVMIIFSYELASTDVETSDFLSSLRDGKASRHEKSQIKKFTHFHLDIYQCLKNGDALSLRLVQDMVCTHDL